MPVAEAKRNHIFGSSFDSANIGSVSVKNENGEANSNDREVDIVKQDAHNHDDCKRNH